MASEANRERTHARALKALLSFPTPCTRGSFRVRLLRDFSRLPQMVSLLVGYDYRRNDGSLSVGNFSSTLRFIINRRPTNLPNSSLDLVALSSYNFICLKQENHVIFNSYLRQCPPSTLYAAYALFFVRTIFKRTFNLAKKKNHQDKKKNMLRTYRTNFFLTAFTFQNPENLNYIMSYMESERTKILFFQHIPNRYGQYLHLHCTCTIH